MARLSCEKFLMNADKTIAGRCRLFGVQVAITDIGGQVYSGAGSRANRTFTFHNGDSDSGDELFKFSLPVGVDDEFGVGTTPFKFMFGDKSILFPDGMFVPALTGSDLSPSPQVDPLPAKTQMVVFYEQG